MIRRIYSFTLVLTVVGCSCPPNGPQDGDVVQLKTGGPIMTIDRCDFEFTTASWFDEHNVMHTEIVSPKAVRLVGK